MASTDPTDLPPRVVNDRKAPRKRTLIGGKVIYGDGASVRDCTIRDISDTGARIALKRGDCIPTRVFLIDRRNPIAYEARVCWINAPEFGLVFLNAYPLGATVSKELEYLDAVWRSLSVPLGGTPL